MGYRGFPTQRAWCDEVMLVRELLKLNMPDAVALVAKHGSAEAVVDSYIEN